MKKNYLYPFLTFLFSLWTAFFLTSCEPISQNQGQQNGGFASQTKQDKTSDSPQKDRPSKKTDALKILTWNLYNFGKSKSDEEIEYIAKTIKGYDVVAIQEIATSPAGAQGVAALADALNRTGAKWDYSLSDPTEGAGTERYAFLWKTAKASLKKAWLESKLANSLDREPYCARFEAAKSGETFMMVNFHAVPSSKDPDKEVEQLTFFTSTYKRDKILIMGDFNISEKHACYDGLKKQGYESAIQNQKTSLRLKPAQDGELLSQEYDNILYESKYFELKKADVIHFYQDFKDLKTARNISDHIPVWIEVVIKTAKIQ
ncbi:endonuclease/exonuclease/phosphatase family protein [Hugenholtzia roseola]|uniref:endonuclease/exonuclease/phosphatase family protein n=1 Tax=Hugenholtzia roseola TaxID=1002 RepID=UPI0003F9CF9E|nr:endonuclease/exonuclease/phosphatase family protein [Hugenholtzia roseola]